MLQDLLCGNSMFDDWIPFFISVEEEIFLFYLMVCSRDAPTRRKLSLHQRAFYPMHNILNCDKSQFGCINKININCIYWQCIFYVTLHLYQPTLYHSGLWSSATTHICSGLYIYWSLYNKVPLNAKKNTFMLFKEPRFFEFKKRIPSEQWQVKAVDWYHFWPIIVFVVQPLSVELTVSS
jgi:hypothetical protein